MVNSGKPGFQTKSEMIRYFWEAFKPYKKYKKSEIIAAVERAIKWYTDAGGKTSTAPYGWGRRQVVYPNKVGQRVFVELGERKEV